MIPRRTNIQSVNSDSSEDEDSGCQVTPRTKVSFVARIRSFCFEFLLDYCCLLQFHIHSLAFLVSLCRRPVSTMRIPMYFYRPQRSCGRVMFLHVSVILFTGLGSGRHPPQADTPPGRHPPLGTATAADGTHPTGMYSCCFCHNKNTTYLIHYIFYFLSRRKIMAI